MDTAENDRTERITEGKYVLVIAKLLVHKEYLNVHQFLDVLLRELVSNKITFQSEGTMDGVIPYTTLLWDDRFRKS